MNEEWRGVPGFPDYEVSNQGRVRSWRGNGNGTRARRGRILKATIGTNGRPKYELSRGLRRGEATRSETKYEHKLVAEAFIGPCPDELETRHIDGDVTNNSLANIVYGTHTENISDKKLHGTFIRGEQSNFAKLTEDVVREIRKSDLPPKEIANLYGTTTNNIYLILSNQTWSHVK